MKVVKKFNYWADQHFFTWVDKRVSDQPQHHLHRRNLYTFPTPMGFAYLLLAILIWLLGTNYQNNLILSLSYLQISLFVVAILHTYFNLAGVAIRYIGCEPVFAGELLKFRLQISTKNKNGCEALECRWRDGPKTWAQVDFGAPSLVEVCLMATGRGLHYPERLLVESRFPFGLIRCWSWLKFPASGVAYPTPYESAWPLTESPSASENERYVRAQGDDFFGLAVYRSGDAPKSIAWKHYARGRGLHTKQFESSVDPEFWLRLEDFNRSGQLELALSCMAYWAVEMTRLNKPFGLSLGPKTLPPDTGEAQAHQVLLALALYGHAP